MLDAAGLLSSSCKLHGPLSEWSLLIVFSPYSLTVGTVYSSSKSSTVNQSTVCVCGVLSVECRGYGCDRNTVQYGWGVNIKYGITKHDTYLPQLYGLWFTEPNF